MTAAHKLYKTLLDQWKSGNNAELKLHCENGSLKVTFHADLGPWAQPDCLRSPVSGNGGLQKVSQSPGRLRRRERRAAERAAAGKAAADCAANLKTTAEEADALWADTVEVDAKEAAAEKVNAKNSDFTEKNNPKKAVAEEVTAEKADLEVIVKNTTAEKVAGEKPAPAEEVASTSCLGSEQSANVLTSCSNCDAEMAPDHQCDSTPNGASKSPVSNVEEQPPPLPLCHYCCHRGSGKDLVHYFLQCVCDDWPCTCWCYCTDAQLEHKKLVFPAGFGLPGYKMKTVNAEDRPNARAIAEARTGKARPCDNPSCMREFEEDNARALGQM